MTDEIHEFNENCWIMYGFRRKGYLYGVMIYESEGGPGSVGFNWQKVVQRAKKIIGFSHTHPGGFSQPSTLDDFTMKGWVKALGKPLICGINCGIQKMFIYERVNGKVECHEVPFNMKSNFVKIKIG